MGVAYKILLRHTVIITVHILINYGIAPLKTSEQLESHANLSKITWIITLPASWSKISAK
jgi:hypothetical protein